MVNLDSWCVTSCFIILIEGSAHFTITVLSKYVTRRRITFFYPYKKQNYLLKIPGTFLTSSFCFFFLIVYKNHLLYCSYIRIQVTFLVPPLILFTTITFYYYYYILLRSSLLPTFSSIVLYSTSSELYCILFYRTMFSSTLKLCTVYRYIKERNRDGEGGSSTYIQNTYVYVTMIINLNFGCTLLRAQTFSTQTHKYQTGIKKGIKKREK